MPFDIMPARSEHGGVNMEYGGIYAADQSFVCGDLVYADDAGFVSEFPADDSSAKLGDMESARICGIAASPGVDRSSGIMLRNPRTGRDYTTGDDIAFWPADNQTIFKTTHVFAAGAAALSTPSGDDVGESYQLTYSTTFGFWGVEKTLAVQGDDVWAAVVAVLDRRGRRVAPADVLTGVWMLFTIHTNG